MRNECGTGDSASAGAAEQGIGPRIGIDGEKEFRQELQNINQQLRTLGSEMKAVTSSFEDGDKSEKALAAQTDVLNRQIDAQKQKLQQLQNGLDASIKKYGEADTRTLRWQQAVNEATASLNKMESQLGDLDNELNGGFLDKLKSQISDLAGDGPLGTLISGGGLGGLLSKGLAVGAVVGGVQQLTGAMFDLVDSTQEYRTIMASLESSSTAAGYSAEQTAQTYGRLQSVLGDTQTAATATANLQAIGLSQEQLMTVTDAAIGAWARYGDSIPIDGLAESINETIQAGQVTGTFADVLNWAGTSEDDFNAKLAEANSTSERANIVMQELANQGLAEAGAAWIENNQDITEANAATDKMDQALARLGEKLAPVAAGLKDLGADAINFLIDQVENAINTLVNLPEKAKEAGEDIIEGLWNGINDMGDWIAGKIQSFGDGVLQSIKDFFGIASPSKVMRDQVGVMIARGLALGIEKGQSTVEKTAVQLGQAITDEITKVNNEISRLEQEAIDQQADAELAEREKKLRELYDELGRAEVDERQSILDEIAEFQAEWDAEQVEKAREAEKEAAQARLEELESFQDEYQKALEDIQNSQEDMASKLRDYGDLFEEADGRLELTDLRDQISQIREYGNALESLRGRGVSDSLLSEITSLDIGDATQYTRQLLQMTDEEYSEYINLWEQKQAEAQRVAEAFYSSELSALDSEYVQKIPETLSDLKGQLVAIGQDSALGLAEGFESEAGSVRSAFVDTIQKALDAAKASMGIHSPSTVWRDEVGANMALGMGEGFLRQMEAMADTITSSIPTPTVDTVNNAAAGMVNGLSALGGLGGNFRIEIPVIIDGKEFYRATIDDLRAVQRANPEVVKT